MKDFLKNHRLIIIIPGVAAAFIAIAVIWALTRGRDIGEDANIASGGRELLEKEYFTDQNYPVNTKEESDGSLTITADGSLTPELAWDYEVKDPKMIQAKTLSEQDGIVSIRVSPLEEGYATVTLSRVGKDSGVSYTAARIDVNMLVTLYDDGTMAVSMSDIYQDSSYAGAEDSKTPFVIEGIKILLPEGGDWEVVETTASGGKAYGLFDIIHGLDDSGNSYIGVYTDVEPYLFAIAKALGDVEDEAGMSEDIGSAAAEEDEAASDEEQPILSLTDEEKELVEGEFADPDYFGRDTGDAGADDPLNGDEIGENELLVVSFGTSFNDSRSKDIGGIEKALAKAYPDWSVRRAFTAQIIINHIYARDGEKIDNVEQALQRAIDNGVKNIVLQPTHLMHGAEYDELTACLDKFKDKFEKAVVAEPLLGEVGKDASIINEDKEKAARAITEEALKEAGFESLDAAKEKGTAFVFMGHGTSHEAKVTYSQMQTQMDKLGYDNVFIGTVEREPEETELSNVIEKVKADAYKNVILRPLMVVAGDHANNDMAGDDEDSWKSGFTADGGFEKVDCQIFGLGGIEEIQKIYIDHSGKAIETVKSSK